MTPQATIEADLWKFVEMVSDAHSVAPVVIPTKLALDTFREKWNLPADRSVGAFLREAAARLLAAKPSISPTSEQAQMAIGGVP